MNRFFKSFLVVFVLVFTLSGCATLRPNESWENLLNKAKKPIYVVSVSLDSEAYAAVLFKDARGKYFTITGMQYRSLKVGDIFH